MLRIYLIGCAILVSAILLNAIIQRFNIVGWYEFLNKLVSVGKITFSTLTIVDYLWLFLVYPLCLGYSYFIGEKLYEIWIGWVK